MEKFKRKKTTSEERKKFFEGFPKGEKPKKTTVEAVKKFKKLLDRYQ